MKVGKIEPPPLLRRSILRAHPTMLPTSVGSPERSVDSLLLFRYRPLAVFSFGEAGGMRACAEDSEHARSLYGLSHPSLLQRRSLPNLSFPSVFPLRCLSCFLPVILALHLQLFSRSRPPLAFRILRAGHASPRPDSSSLPPARWRRFSSVSLEHAGAGAGGCGADALARAPQREAIARPRETGGDGRRHGTTRDPVSGSSPRERTTSPRPDHTSPSRRSAL
ncbi:hypothetical protein MRX96_016347 [Rhipicephalus microplus]